MSTFHTRDNRRDKDGYYRVSPIVSIRAMLDQAVKEAGDADAYRTIVSDTEIRHITFSEFCEDTENLGAALCARGFPDCHFGCVGDNSYGWITAYLTVLKSAGVFVPLDRELPINDLVRVIDDADCRVLFYGERFEAVLAQIRCRLPKVVCFIGIDRKTSGDGFLSMAELIEEGKKLDKSGYDALNSDPDALKMLVYTSGTTGIAKGVMLSEHNLVSGIYYGMQVSRPLSVGLSVLPYHHTYESVCDILVAIHRHSTLCINDAMKNVVKNMKRFSPDYVYLVPAILELFYANMMRGLKKQGKLDTVNGLIEKSNKLRRMGIDLRSVFFRPLNENFGGNLRKIVCGGAPIRPDIGEFFGNIGIWVIGGYGITECSPLVSVNDEKANDYHTVGRRLPCLQWKIDAPNEEGIGEILVKGDVVMKGYYHRPEETARAFDPDGWFHTGDYGRLTPEDWLVITGRKKNIIVLNNGKNIYPEEIEACIGTLPYVSEVVVRSVKNEFGQDTHLMAEVYLSEYHDEQAVLKEAKETLAHLPSYKMISAVSIRREPFEKTTTNKIKR